LPLKLSKLIGYISSIIFSILFVITSLINQSGLYLILLLSFFIRINITNIILLNKEYHNFLLDKYLNPNSSLKIKETKIFTYNPIENLFIGKNTVFNLDTFKVSEEVVLDKYFKNEKKIT
jgi:hypothetical protein